MSISIRGPYEYEDREAVTTRWIIIFILLSLLAHIIIIGGILLITHFLPVPKIEVPAPPKSVNLVLEKAPPAPPPKPVFVPTQPQAHVQHKLRPIESANDTELQSRSKTARAPDSIMPDVTGKEHAPNLNESPNSPAPPHPQVSSTPPTPRQAKPEKPTPPQPKPDQAQQPPPRPPQPAPKPHPPTPPQKAQPLVDPVTGLPVLPPINAPTLAPQNQASQPLAPVASLQQQAASVHGALGRSGDNSPAAMATELGKYKQYVYSVVGSHWYPDIDKHFGIIGVGMVHIQFTIHSDGTITDVTVLEGDNLQTLRDISTNALLAPAPYKPFSDAMIKEVGDSYTDDFSFSVY